MPRYSIITPTIVRTTLPVLCESIDRQTNSDWEHLIAVDVDLHPRSAKMEILNSLAPKLDHWGIERRRIHRCLIPHQDTGNTCRHEMSKIARGDYVLFIDDDNFYADERVLETLGQVTASIASFSLLYKNQVHTSQPIESSNVMVKNELRIFPVLKDRDADQVFVTNILRRGYECQVINDRPLVVVPYENTGVDH